MTILSSLYYEDVFDKDYAKEMRRLQIAYAEEMWAWAKIESEIFMVYVAAVHGLQINDTEALRASFFSINSFEMRLTMAHAAVKTRWGESPCFADWTALRVVCDKAARKRGRIAHKTGMSFPPTKPHQKRLYVLLDPIWHSNHPNDWGTAKSIGIDVNLLNTYRDEWIEFDSSLRSFWHPLWRQDILGESPEPAIHPSPEHQHKDGQIPEESESLPEPSPA